MISQLFELTFHILDVIMVFVIIILIVILVRMAAQNSATIIGGGLLEKYIVGEKVDPISEPSRIDAKDLTAKKLQIAAKKQINLENFVTKLVSNTLIYMQAHEKFPTDVGNITLKTNKKLLNEAADLLDKKYPDTIISRQHLRKLARDIENITVNNTQLNTLGDLSREELLAKYVYNMSGKSQFTELPTELNAQLAKCRTELAGVELLNEKLNAELRRGLTHTSCEILLRDCNEEKNRLYRELEILRNRPAREDCSKLNQEINNLKDIISVLQRSEQSDNDTINNLKHELNECQKFVNEITAQM